MTTHDHIRHEQSLALRDGLLGSSFSFLTIAVAVLCTLSLRGTPRIEAPAAPDWIPVPTDFRDYVPLPDTPGVPVPVPAVAEPGPIVPVEDEALVRDPLPFEPARVTTPDLGLVPGIPGVPGGNGVAGTGGGGSRPLPPPGEYIPHDEVPQVVIRVRPTYPELALQARLEGRVVVRAFVGTDGRIVKAEAEGEPSLFDEAATSAVAQWVFTPALAGSHPVAVWVRVPVVFRLE